MQRRRGRGRRGRVLSFPLLSRFSFYSSSSLAPFSPSFPPSLLLPSPSLLSLFHHLFSSPSPSLISLLLLPPFLSIFSLLPFPSLRFSFHPSLFFYITSFFLSFSIQTFSIFRMFSIFFFFSLSLGYHFYCFLSSLSLIPPVAFLSFITHYSFVYPLFHTLILLNHKRHCLPFSSLFFLFISLPLHLQNIHHPYRLAISSPCPSPSCPSFSVTTLLARHCWPCLLLFLLNSPAFDFPCPIPPCSLLFFFLFFFYIYIFSFTSSSNLFNCFCPTLLLPYIHLSLIFFSFFLFYFPFLIINRLL